MILHPSQDIDHGSIVDDTAHAYGENQRTHALEKNILIKFDAKDMNAHVTKAIKIKGKP